MSRQISVFATLLALCAGSLPGFAADDDYRDERTEMVEVAVVREGITNRAVIQALLEVPRHEFVPTSLHKEAYVDKALPIGYQQTISPPYIVAYMTESLDPKPTDRILEIGTGSGYQAAVLGEICKEVYSIEIVSQLGRAAGKRLEKLGYDNVHTKVGDGYKGWEEHSPFDGIIVTCSPESVPQPLVDQLREGGRMIVPLGERYQQVFYLFEKVDGRLKPTKLVPTLFVPMTGESEERRVKQPDGSNPEIINGSFELDDNKDDQPDHWHYQRQVERVTGGARDGEVFLTFKNDEPGRPAQMLQGLALDGRHVAFVNLSVDVKIDSVTPGEKSFDQPAMVIHFYDQVRRSLGEGIVGPWLRRSDWERLGRRIPVPPGTREAIVRIGLNGATGSMSIDDIKLSFIPR